MNGVGCYVQSLIEPQDTVLDLGCGIMQGTDDIKSKTLLGCDIWMPYLDKIKHLFPTIKISMDELDRFPDSSYDVVIALDSIEHLDKKIALKVLDEMKRICRKKAVVYTPIEFDSNEYQIEDSWGMGKCEYQKHNCLIEKMDLRSRNYKIKSHDTGFLAVFEK